MGVFGLAAQRDGAKRAFSLLSRGDRVHGCTIRPAHEGPHPVVLLAGPDGCARSSFVENAAAAWCARAALVSLDLPLCGARRGDKLSALAFKTGTKLARRLRPELEAQLAADLERVLEFIASDPELDASRVTFVGVGLGRELSRAFLAAPAGVAQVVLAPSSSPGSAWFKKLAAQATRR